MRCNALIQWQQHDETSVRYLATMVRTLTGLFLVSLLGLSLGCSDELPFGTHVELDLMFSYGRVYDGNVHDGARLSINADGLRGRSGCIPLNSDDVDMWWDKSDTFQYKTVEPPPAGTNACFSNDLRYEDIIVKGGTFHFEYFSEDGTVSLTADLPPDYSASIIPGTRDEVVAAQQFRIEWTTSQVAPPSAILWKTVPDETSSFNFPKCELVESGEGYAVFELPPDLPVDYFSENVPIEVEFVDIIQAEHCQGVETCSVSVLKDFRFFDN